MADCRISRVQRNDVFQIAVGAGLDASAFEWRDIDLTGNVVSEIAHPATGAFLTFDVVDGTDGKLYSLHNYWPINVNVDTNYQPWREVLESVALWLAAVKEESEAPDFWALAKDERAWLTAAAPASGNTVFSQIEREQIAEHLRAIEAYAVQTFKLEAGKAAYVHGRMEYLAEAAGRVGRIDWKNIAVSTMIAMVFELALDPEKGRRLLGFATQLLGPLVSAAIRLLS